MIASLRGTLIARSIDELVIECAGVGYGVIATIRAVESLGAVGEEVFVLVHTIVKEDALDLYGFSSAAEREMFRRLISVSGVGPKSALGALSVFSPNDLQQAFMNGDERALMRIPGVGKKTAQRMLLELGEKMTRVLPQTSPQGSIIDAPANVMSDLELALGGLGYAPREIQRVSAQIHQEGAMTSDLQVLIRRALSLLKS